MFRKSLIAAFIVFFGTAFVAMPVAAANPLVDIWETLTGNEDDGMQEEPTPGGNPGDETGEDSGQDEQFTTTQPEPEDSTEGEDLVEEPPLPESQPEKNDQAKSGNSHTQSQSASGNTSVNNAASGNGGQLPKTATPYPMMLLVGGLVMAAGLALLKVRPSRG